ncbi:hypothetical protein [Synechococcus phage S-B68]|nr:hypothetical protein [Synechococcus phage S-B68]
MTGLIIKAASDLLIMVWAGSNRLYDVVFVTAIFSALNLHKIFSVLF